MKTCKQCGLTKDEQEFRANYNRPGTFNVCLQCERINSRYKYLKRKDKLSQRESDELQKIEELYTRQRSMGLRPPRPRMSVSIDAVLNQYNKEAERWLTEELTEDPDYYIDIVFEDLQCADKEIRDKVLQRFYEYEDQYYKSKE
jgi:hypothetical protein